MKKKLLNIFLFLFAGFILFRVWSIHVHTNSTLILQTIAGAIVMFFMLFFADNFLPRKKRKHKIPYTIKEEKQLLQDIILSNPRVFEINIKKLKRLYKEDFEFIQISVNDEEMKNQIEIICKTHNINSYVEIIMLLEN